MPAEPFQNRGAPKRDNETDTAFLERQRGSRHSSVVISFQWQEVNIVDTPGHAEFLAEGKRSLAI